MKKILFVCHGNICRSPMAEFIMKKLVKDAGLSSRFEIASAATSSEELGNSVYPPARRKLAEHGIGCEGKTARRISAADYRYYDLIIGMDSANMRNMHRVFSGDPEGKLHLLLDYAGRKGESVADPWYTGDFDSTWDDVLAGCSALLMQLECVKISLDFSRCKTKDAVWRELCSKMESFWRGQSLLELWEYLSALEDNSLRFVVRSPGEDAPHEAEHFAERIIELLDESALEVTVL